MGKLSFTSSFPGGGVKVLGGKLEVYNWETFPNVRSGLNCCIYFHILEVVGDGKSNPIIRFYILNIRMPFFQGGMTMPKVRSFFHPGTYSLMYLNH